ncbi:MAG: hypothetical protein ACREV5_21085 [Steroidobacter sp.]
MKPDRSVNSIVGYFAMAAATVASVTAATVIDVQLSLSSIDPSNPATWPNMAPQIRYYFIPVLSICLAVGCVLINICLQLIAPRQFTLLRYWVFLGIAFSLSLLGFPLINAGLSPAVAFALSMATALVAVVLIRWRYGVPVDYPAV